MANIIEKIIQQSTAPKDKNVLWDNGEELKINRRGVWESANKGGTSVDGDTSIILKYLTNPVMVTDTGGDIPSDLAKVIMYLDPDYSEFKIPVFGLFYVANDEVYFPVTSCTSNKVVFGNGVEFSLSVEYTEEDDSYNVTLG